MPAIDGLFEEMLERGASDLHLEEGQRPRIRLNGALTDLDRPVLEGAYLFSMMKEMCNEVQWAQYLKTGDLDFAYDMENKARFRSNFFRFFNGYGAIFRVIPSRIMSLEELEAPEIFKTFAYLQSGLVLITGPTGSGKSTTLAAIVDYFNKNLVKKIVTIEDPVEFVHQNRNCLIIHREVGEDTVSFVAGLRSAIKSDVDVVLVGEMRDRETIELALTATEMGVLVFGTLHTNSAAKTLDRITDAFPTGQQGQIRTLLSYTLRGVVSQQLLRSTDGSRRYAAHEILLYTPPLTGIIRAGDMNALVSYIQTGKKLGMQTMDDNLLELVKSGKVSFEDAYTKAQDKARFKV